MILSLEVSASATPGDIEDIPDLDEAGGDTPLERDMKGLDIGGSSKAGAEAPPDLDDIPDMDDMEEQGLEEDEDAGQIPLQPECVFSTIS